MILRRVIEHVKAQNWTAVSLDFLIVVIGVFVGIQVSNWNDARVDQRRAQDYLARIGGDLDADIAAIADRVNFWGRVADYGALGLNYAETGEPGDHTQWDLLLAYFQASQVAELVPLQATFDELKSAGELGLIADPAFRNALSDYYMFTASATVTERPPYRAKVRGVIPLSIQSYIWDNCYASSGSERQTLLACASPVDEERAAKIVAVISEDTALMADLRYWLSSLHVARLIGDDRMSEAATLRRSVDELLAKR